MSKFRHPDASIKIRSFGVTFRTSQKSLAVLQDSKGWHQLIYATRGVITVFTDEGAWVVPPHRAIWLPAGMAHRIETKGEVAIRALYLLARKRLAAQRCSVVNVTPLLRELIVRTNLLGALDSKIAQHKHLIALIYDELKTMEAVPLQLPWPRDERAKKFTVLATAEKQAETGLPQMLREAGLSRRTLERIFRSETSLSLGQWLRRHKLLEALKLVAAGEAVKTVSDKLGYNSPSAFVAMFRRELGETPKRYFSE